MVQPRARADDHGHFAENARKIGQSFEAEAQIFLVRLGEFAGHAHFARAEQGQGVFQGFFKPVLALEENQRGRNSGVGRERVFLIGALARQKAEEHEGLRRNAGTGQRRDRSARPGNDGNRQSGFAAGADDHVAGIGHDGHARVGNERDVFPFAQKLQHRGRLFLFVVVVIADEAAHGDAPAGTGEAFALGVFGEHQIRRFEAGPGPGRKITRVAKRRSHHPQRAGFRYLRIR